MSQTDNDVSVASGIREALALSWRPFLLPVVLGLSFLWSLLVFPIIFVLAPVWGFLKGYTRNLNYADRKKSKAVAWEKRLTDWLALATWPIEKMIDL